MNDLDLVRDLTPEAPLPGPGDLTGVRGRLTAAIAAERPGGRLPQLPPPGAGRPRRAAGPVQRGGVLGRRTPNWPARRLRLTAAAAAVAAAAVAIALVAVPSHGQPRTTVRPSTRPAPARPSTQQEPATVDVAAARFLRHAAATARLQHASPPGPDQFVYTETEGAGGTDKDQQWLSTYGNRNGLLHNAGQRSYVVPPCTVAETQVAQKSPPGVLFPRTYHCAEAAGYLPSMPADPQKLLAYLYKIRIAQPGDSNGTSWATNDFGKAVDFLMSTTYLLPAQQAALFELMARFPGFTIVHDARDALGRVGVAIEWTYDGSAAEIILNPATYAYMGDRTSPGLSFQGNEYDGDALVKIAFVSKAGEQP
jgi:hypothetical protein